MGPLHFNPLRAAPVAVRRPWREAWVQRLAAMARRWPRGDAADPRHQLGRHGEDLACRFLRRQGYQILERNRALRLTGRHWMEFDFIAREGGVLVFVEVKTRQAYQPGFAAERAVHPAKRRRLLQGARAYRIQHDLRGRYRFDVVCVYGPDQPAPEIRLLRDAFFPCQR